MFILWNVAVAPAKSKKDWSRRVRDTRNQTPAQFNSFLTPSNSVITDRSCQCNSTTGGSTSSVYVLVNACAIYPKRSSPLYHSVSRSGLSGMIQSISRHESSSQFVSHLSSFMSMVVRLVLYIWIHDSFEAHSHGVVGLGLVGGGLLEPPPPRQTTAGPLQAGREVSMFISSQRNCIYLRTIGRGLSSPPLRQPLTCCDVIAIVVWRWVKIDLK